MALKYYYENFKNGWLVGDFEPAIIRDKNVEVCLKYFKKGQTEDPHVHKIAIEYTLVVFGSMKMQNNTYNTGEICVIRPGDVSWFEAIEDCACLCIKTPSVPSDKYLAGEE